MKQYRELYKLAVQAREYAYVPYSGFRVGAALLCDDGTVFTGVNIENASYGATICAERTAFAKALSEGKRRFIAIAIAAGEASAFPCGICRQFMYEFGTEIQIITGVNEVDLVVHTLAELLPEGFVL